MGALLSLPISLLNFLLPFTKPGTPILQDLIHTAILCGTLYYAPQIAEWYNTRQLGNTSDGTPRHEEQDVQQAEPQDPQDAAQNHLPENERPNLQPQIEDEAEPILPWPGPPAQPQPQPQPQHQRAFFPPDEPGPAHDRPRPTAANRTIGAKKAKSLARKDQRRAYHEFHRQEAELRRLQAAEGASERDAVLLAEKTRRAAAEAEIVERERREREERKREVEREAEEEGRRRERALQSVRDEVREKLAVNLRNVAWKEGKDTIWVEKLVRASGLLAQLEREFPQEQIMITRQGSLVRISHEVLKMAYAEAEEVGRVNGGKVSFEEFGVLLERAVLEGALQRIARAEA